MQTQNQRITIEEISSKLKPVLGSKIDDLYFRYTISESLEEKNEIMQILGSLYQKHLGKFLDKKILLEPPQKSEAHGEYPISDVIYAGKELFKFGLKEGDFPRHLCISGMSGSGKTTLAFNILSQLIEKDKPFLVFDWKKSFRPLMNLDGSIMCFTVGNDSVSNLFKININIPPKGVSPREWINVLCDLLTESFAVSFGVHKILLETLDEVFEGWGVYQNSKHYPNWQHIRKMLEIKAKEARGREATWYESALRIATVLTFGDFGKVINYDGKKSLSMEDLLDKRVIFELNSLGNIEKKFFSEFILTYIYKLKKAGQNKSSNEFNHAILVDEAHNIFLKNKTNFLSESVTDMVYREMREYGISLICLDQHISKLSDTVKGNSACHIAFQQQLPQDVYDVSSLMQLFEKKDFFSSLPVGYAIVKLSERYTSPFLIKVPFIDTRNNSIDDNIISERMKCVVTGIESEHEPEFHEAITNPKQPETQIEIIVTPEISRIQEVLRNFILEQLSRGEFLDNIEALLLSRVSEGFYTEEDVKEALAYTINLENPVKENAPEKNYAFSISEIVEDYSAKDDFDVSKYPFLKPLNEDEKQFAVYLIKNPNHKQSTVELYKNIGLSTRKGNVIKNALLNKGLIEIYEEKNEKGWKKLIRLPLNIH